jgi:hypothetical protein
MSTATDYILTPVIEDRLIIQKLKQRIEAARQWKREHPGQELPNEIEFEELVPGTKDLRSEIVMQKTSGKNDRHEIKFRNGGTIGLSIDRQSFAARAVYGGTNFGKFATFREAAAVYDEYARRVEGENAVTNDPEAVRRKDEWLDEMLRQTGIERFGKRRHGVKKWCVKIPKGVNCK